MLFASQIAHAINYVSFISPARLATRADRLTDLPGVGGMMKGSSARPRIENSPPCFCRQLLPSGSEKNWANANGSMQQGPAEAGEMGAR